MPKLHHQKTPDLFSDEVTHVGKGDSFYYPDGTKYAKWQYEIAKMRPDVRSHKRSKTFPGIARAMAEQWGKLK
jgi:hypothetical protein